MEGGGAIVFHSWIKSIGRAALLPTKLHQKLTVAHTMCAEVGCSLCRKVRRALSNVVYCNGVSMVINLMNGWSVNVFEGTNEDAGSETLHA